MEPYIVDIDDFSESKNQLWALRKIKEAIPKFKATMFTVVGLCSYDFVCKMREMYPWLDMAPHGMFHDLEIECATWTREDCAHCLDLSEAMGLTKGFRAPGWRISDATYQELFSRGYWVADSNDNNSRRPEGLKCYLLDSEYKLHFHVQDGERGLCQNGLRQSMDKILALDRSRPFAFIRDLF